MANPEAKSLSKLWSCTSLQAGMRLLRQQQKVDPVKKELDFTGLDEELVAF